jgi:DNA polymerase-3 subunit epsilon
MTPAAPPWRDRRRSWRTARFTAFDVETTGLDPARDDVISFGAVPIQGGQIVMAGSAYELVRPRVSPSPTSVVVHGLRTQDLLEAPGLDATRRRLTELLSGRFLLTWYGSVENAFLAKLFGGGPRARAWARRNVDVRGLAIEAGLGSGGPLSLSAVAGRLSVPVGDPHHAFDDALVTAQLFLVLASRRADGRSSVRSLLRRGRTRSTGG